MSSISLQNKIASTLRNIATPKCITEAIRIESLPTLKRRFHFRDLGLTADHVETILDILDEGHDYEINSISFSHNLIGDEGAEIIAHRLPNTIEEIGLVDCGITDIGAKILLSQLHILPNLDMLCLENNILSEHVKLEYQKYGAFNRDMMIIV